MTASVGGGAALESALLGRAGRNFTLALGQSQSRYDSAWAALTNPPVLDMALVRSRADLQARAEAVRRSVNAARDLRDFAENTPEIYRQELQRHKLAPSAREEELQKFAGDLAAVSPTIIAMRRAQVRAAEALLRLVLRLEASWCRWEYVPRCARRSVFRTPNRPTTTTWLARNIVRCPKRRTACRNCSSPENRSRGRKPAPMNSNRRAPFCRGNAFLFHRDNFSQFCSSPLAGDAAPAI